MLFEDSSYSVTEGQPSVEVCAVTSATPAPGQIVSAQLSTANEFALGKGSPTLLTHAVLIVHAMTYIVLSLTAGEDYSALQNIALTFTSTSERQCVNIGIINDQLIEPTETFIVRIDQTTSQGTVSTQAFVLITDGKLST